MPLGESLFLIHTAATLFMTGLIWFVQIVHYPLFAQISAERFAAYQQRNIRSTTAVASGPMLVEAATGVLLLWQRPAGLASWELGLGLVLLAAAWGSTWRLQVPRHRRLAAGFDARCHRQLVVTNWIRTVAWSGRAGIILWVLAS